MLKILNLMLSVFLSMTVYFVSTTSNAQEATHKEQSNDYTQEIESSLKRGELHNILVDNMQIIDPRSKEGATFNSLMHKHVMPYLSSGLSEPSKVRFVLTKNQAISAFAFPQAVPPVVGVSTGLLENLESLDELVGIIAHELSHVTAYVDKKNSGNISSKFEEGYADIQAVSTLNKNGLHPKSYINFLKRLNNLSDNNKFLNAMQIIFDVHPLAKNRVDIAQKKLFQIENETGFTSTATPTPLPTEIKNHASKKTIVFKSFMQKESERFDYMNRSDKQKYEFLTANIKYLNVDIEIRDDYYIYLMENLQSKDLRERLTEQLRISQCDRIIVKFYKKHPMLIKTKLNNAIRSFIRSTSFEAAEDRATVLLELLAKTPEELLQNLSLVNFAAPTNAEMKVANLKEPIKTSWFDHLHWAKSNSSKPIAQALFSLQICEQSLIDIMREDESHINYIKVSDFLNPEHKDYLFNSHIVVNGVLVKRYKTASENNSKNTLIPYQHADYLLVTAYKDHIHNTAPVNSIKIAKTNKGKTTDPLSSIKDSNTFVDTLSKRLDNLLAYYGDEQILLDQLVSYLHVDNSFLSIEQKKSVLETIVDKLLSMYDLDYYSKRFLSFIGRLGFVPTINTLQEFPKIWATNQYKDYFWVKSLLISRFHALSKQDQLNAFSYFKDKDHIKFINYIDRGTISGLPSTYKTNLHECISGMNWSSDLEELVDEFHAVNNTIGFKDRTLYNAVFKTIFSKITALPDNDERKFELVRKLLTHNILAQYSIRNELENIFVNQAFQKYGIDDGSTEYYNRLKHLVDEMSNFAKNNKTVQHEIFFKLSWKLELQEKLSLLIQEYTSINANSRIENHGIMSIELIFEAMKTDKGLSLKILEYLTSTTDNIDQNKNNLIEYLKTPKEDQSYSYQSILHAAGQERYLASDIDNIYDNFWGASFYTRLLIMEQILLSSNKQNIDKSLNMILQRFIPNEPLAKDIASTYISLLPEEHRVLFATALVVAEKQNQEANITSIGAKLAKLFEFMGPAEFKLGQIIHSHPSTPEDIRKDLARMKSMAGMPNRWDLIALYNEVVPKSVKNKILHVGKILGAASYYVVCEVTLKNGKKAAISLRRPHAAQRAKRGFELLKQLTIRLQHRYPEFADIVSDMIVQAQSMAELETNHEAMKVQFNIANKLYDGLEIKSEDSSTKTFSLSPAKPINIGDGYVLMEKLEGVHLDDIINSSTYSKKYKKDLNLAIITSEFYHLLKGGYFDHDRHGGNYLIDDYSIGVLDFGSIGLTEVSSDDRKLLIKVLLNTIEHVQNVHDIPSKFLDEIKILHKAEGGVPVYLMEVQKAMLALSELMKTLDLSDFTQIFKAILTKGEIHEDFLAGILEHMTSKDLTNNPLISAMMGASDSNNATQITITQKIRKNCKDLLLESN